MIPITSSLPIRLGLLLVLALLLVAAGAQAGIERWLDRIHQQITAVGR